MPGSYKDGITADLEWMRRVGIGGVQNFDAWLFTPVIVDEKLVFMTPEWKALELGAPSYRFLRRYLDRRPPVPLTLRQVDPLIRQLTLYRDLIDRTTGDPE